MFKDKKILTTIEQKIKATEELFNAEHFNNLEGNHFFKVERNIVFSVYRGKLINPYMDKDIKSKEKYLTEIWGDE